MDEFSQEFTYKRVVFIASASDDFYSAVLNERKIDGIITMRSDLPFDETETIAEELRNQIIGLTVSQACAFIHANERHSAKGETDENSS